VGTGDETWERALAAAGEAFVAGAALDADRAATLERLRRALRGGDARRALLLLNGLHPAHSVPPLVDDVVGRALSQRDGLLAREVLGRLHRDEAARIVPPAVWRLLDAEGDHDAYRMMAGLLSHLGLADALRELCGRARRSEDAGVREVGAEYAGEAE
jgi:hypothetical protein